MMMMTMVVVVKRSTWSCSNSLKTLLRDLDLDLDLDLRHSW